VHGDPDPGQRFKLKRKMSVMGTFGYESNK
jgi:hypothetical protein